MKKFEEYVTDSSLEYDYKSLCNSELQENSPEVDNIIINFVIKYLAKYMNVRHITRANLFIVIQEHLQPDFGLSCLADIRSTAAIFKHIMFSQDYDAHTQHFRGIDLGCGTGILMVPMIINAVRNNIKKITCIGLDIDDDSLKKAENVLDFTDANIQFEQEDITAELPYDWVEKNKPEMIVSETINNSIAPFSVSKDGEVISKKPESAIFKEWHRDIDPYRFVIEKLLDIPGFYQSIKERKQFLFPDIINNHLEFQGNKIALRLSDTDFIQLQEFRNKFYQEYEDFSVVRWPTDEMMEESSFEMDYLLSLL